MTRAPGLGLTPRRHRRRASVADIAPVSDPSLNGYAGVLLTCAVLGLILAALAVVVAAGPGWVRPARRGLPN